MSNDIEIYKKSGMYDTLGKPFTSQELWSCLLRYIPVEGYTDLDGDRRDADNAKLQNWLRVQFIKKNSNAYTEITAALDAGDVILAHRLVHTLKGNAGQLNRTKLQEAADDVENSLSGGKNLASSAQMEKLETELNAVLSELGSGAAALEDDEIKDTEVVNSGAENESTIYEFTAAELELLKKLESLLKSSDSECLDLTDSLRSIPGCAAMIEFMEDFDFISAAKALDALIK